MPVYTIHKPAASKPDQIEAFVPDAWSWPAFIFGGFWLVFHRQWLAALGYGLLWLAIMVGGTWLGLHPFAALMLTNLLAFWLALEGSSIRRWTLARKGRPVAAVVAAGDVREAEMRYFAGIASQPATPVRAVSSVPVTLPPRPTDSGVLGLFPEKGGW